MPGFTSTRPNLEADGPTLDIIIRPPILMLQALAAGPSGQMVPATQVQAVAMVDTGAQGTVITPAIAQQLGLQPTGSALAGGATGHAPVSANVYNVDIIFGAGVLVPNVAVMELPLAGQKIQALIGRDILRHGMLIYLGHANQFTLGF
jgi:predicted aspartyl protease